MPIELNCPSCSQTLRVPDDAAGKHARCAQCQAVILVPGNEAPSSPQPPSQPSESPFGGPSQSPTPMPAKPGPQQDINPFQSPTTHAFQDKPGFGDGDPNKPVRPQAADFGPIMGRAFDLWKANLGLLVGVTFVVAGINWVISFTSGVLMEIGGPELAFLGIGVNILAYLVTIFLGIGQAQIMLSMARNQPANFGQLFGGGSRFLPVFGGLLVAFVVYFALAMVIAVPAVMLGNAAIFLVMISSVVLMIGISIVMWPFYWLIVDNRAGVIESFGVALDMGKRNIGTTLVIWLASVGIMMLGFAACLVGMLFAAPLVGMMYAVGYLAMSGQIHSYR